MVSDSDVCVISSVSSDVNITKCKWNIQPKAKSKILYYIIEMKRGNIESSLVFLKQWMFVPYTCN